MISTLTWTLKAEEGAILSDAIRPAIPAAMNLPWRAYWSLMRFDRPVGTLLLLWPTLTALWFAAKGLPPVNVLLAFIFGTVVMRAAGCVVNDLADRDFDPHVERTRQRPLATGALSVRQAWFCFGALLLIAAGIVLSLNVVTRWMAVVGVLFAAVYPLLKRFTHFAQLGLGVAFSWGIPMASTAVLGTVTLEIWCFFLSSFLWIVAYDTEYAMVDRKYDLKLGLHSTAILFGSFDLPAVALLNSVVFALWIFVGVQVGMGWVYFIALAGVAALFVYQSFLLRKRDEADCFRAFLNNATVGLVLFIGAVGDFLLRVSAT